MGVMVRDDVLYEEAAKRYFTEKERDAFVAGAKYILGTE